MLVKVLGENIRMKLIVIDCYLILCRFVIFVEILCFRILMEIVLLIVRLRFVVVFVFIEISGGFV